MTLQGRTAIVIGGSGQIGSAIVQGLAAERCRVAAVSRHADRSAGLLKHDDNVIAYPADCTRESDVARCFRTIAISASSVDFVIHAAAIEPDPDTPLAEYPLEAWHRTLDTYLTSFFLCFRESLRVVCSGGHIVALSSAVTRFRRDALPPDVFLGHYATAKAGMDEFCKWARREANQRSILLSRLAPGAVDVPFHQTAPPARRPNALLPMQTVVDRVLWALRSSTELDEQLVATP